MSAAPPCRIVVKVGTSTLTDTQGRIDRAFIADLTIQLAAIRKSGRDVLLVTSGAIRAGRERLSGRRERAGAGSRGWGADGGGFRSRWAAAIGSRSRRHAALRLSPKD